MYTSLILVGSLCLMFAGAYALRAGSPYTGNRDLAVAGFTIGCLELIHLVVV